MKDCHVYTSYTDKKYPEIAHYITKAKELGIDELTITDLYEIKEGAPLVPFAWYKLAYNRVKSEDIKLNLGFEMGLQPGIHEKIFKTANEKSLDYVVGSTNIIGGEEVSSPGFFMGKDEDEVYRKYFEYVLNNVNEFSDCFDVYAKLDQVIRYNGDRRLDYDRYAELLDAILESLVKNGKGLEVSTQFCSDNDPWPMPYMRILGRYRELGGKIITLGSGATSVENLGKYYEYAYDLIESVGFDSIATYHNRTPDFDKIKSLRR